ncbi:hypothetical protein KK062_06715 [Fulvivirgaceae bacterium PWU5]|uniref:Uncharacterized protein n=1 Tax=Dawidia cretensis TaxID=2782350 RepID=A0AAP2DWZ5_9BACT|nr:hypothetical protein [Dawidia cretensis]MBT1707904.1 hypothetical protein [Dawidia cretensis]
MKTLILIFAAATVLTFNSCERRSVDSQHDENANGYVKDLDTHDSSDVDSRDSAQSPADSLKQLRER